MKTLLIRNILGIALIGAMSQYVLASDNSFSSPIKDEAFEENEARRMANLINNQSILEELPEELKRKQPTISVGKGIGEASTAEDVTMDFTSGIAAATVSNPNANITVGSGIGVLKTESKLTMKF